MKSTIKIGLGQGNEPTIFFNVRASDDLRDQVCCQWLHGLGFESNLCHVAISGDVIDERANPAVFEHHLELTPLLSKSHFICHQRVEEIYKCLHEQYPELYMTTGGGTIGFYINKGNGPGVELNRDDLVSMSIVDLFNEITKTIERLVFGGSVSTEKSGLPSRYQIEDPITTEDIFDGEVVAVKFTIGKVYYDILNKLSGKVIENVDSTLIQDTNNYPKPIAI